MIYTSCYYLDLLIEGSLSLTCLLLAINSQPYNHMYRVYLKTTLKSFIPYYKFHILEFTYKPCVQTRCTKVIEIFYP